MVGRIIDVFINRSKDITVLERRAPGWHYYPSEFEASQMPVNMTGLAADSEDC
jgi:hypothetical protein